jgi:hypothetical protein
MLSVFEAKEMARQQGLDANDPAIIRSIQVRAGETGTIGVPSSGFSYSGPTGSAVGDFATQRFLDPLRRSIHQISGGAFFNDPPQQFMDPGFNPVDAITSKAQSLGRLLSGPEAVKEGLSRDVTSGLFPKEEPPTEPEPPREPPKHVERKEGFMDILKRLNEREEFSVPLPPELQVPQMRQMAAPDYSGARQIFAEGAPKAPTPVSKQERISTLLGALAGGGNLGLRGRRTPELAYVLSGAGGQASLAMNRLREQERQAIDAYNERKSQYSTRQALFDVTLNDKSREAEQRRIAADFQNELARFNYTKERDKLKMGGMKFVDGQAVYTHYDPASDSMKMTVMRTDQVDQLLNFARIQATFAMSGTRGREKIKAGTYEISRAIVGDGPMLVPTTLAAAATGGIIGHGLRPRFEAEAITDIEERFGNDAAILAGQWGEKLWQATMDRYVFYAIMELITGPAGKEPFDQLAAEFHLGAPSNVGLEEE